MTDGKKEKILSLLAKLKAMSLDKTTVEESALAAQRMQELSTKYNIELAELDTYDPEDLSEIVEGTCYTEKGVQIQTWKIHLAMAIARNNFCKIVSNPGNRYYKIKSSVTVVGNVDNTRIVRYMFAAISNAVESACRWHMRAGYGKGKRWSNSFKIGAVNVVAMRLTEATQSVRKVTSTTVLVRIDRESDRVSGWMRDHMDLVRGPARGVTIGDVGGLSLGMEAGSKIDLGGPGGGALGSGRKSLPGR